MFLSKLEPDKGELKIVFDVQWQTPDNDHDDKAKIIGIVDAPDTYLDWNTFKSYLIQNSGNMHFTTDDIRISYIDSDDDLIPIDSEAEFRECLKFSRVRARRGKQVVMKVNMTGAKPKEPTITRDDYVPKNSKPTLFCVKQLDANRFYSKTTPEKGCGSDAGNVREATPEWFESYMAKFKVELVKEVTTAVMAQVSSSSNSHGHNRRSIISDYTKLHYPIIEKRKKKKKMHEEDSSDCTDGLQLHWEDKPPELPRNLQKIIKREKKYESKFDSKLEKLELKAKKLIEKKMSNNFGLDLKRSKAKKTYISNTVPCGDVMMNVMPVNEYNYVLRVPRGQTVVHTWEVINNGQFPWNDETELRHAWGSKSLVPLTPLVKCPHLECGATGTVQVTLQAPVFVGNYESYWYFHHQGHRFGHWLGCTVIVEAEQRPEQQDAVDLTMKCPHARSLSEENLAGCGILNQNPVLKEACTIRYEALKVYDELIESEMANLTIADKAAKDAEKKNESEKLIDIDAPIEQPKNEEVNNVMAEQNVQIVQNELDKFNDPEYISGSSSDEMSILSGTVSLDDTEPSDEFVVVPMPACFNLEKPLNDESQSSSVPVTQPITVEIPESSSVQSSDNNNNMELIAFPQMPVFLPVASSSLTESKNQESGYSEGENEENVCTGKKGQDECNKTPEDEFTVYGTDNFGVSIPVARVIKPKAESAPESVVGGEQQQEATSEQLNYQQQQAEAHSTTWNAGCPHMHHPCFHHARCQRGPQQPFVFEEYPVYCGAQHPELSQCRNQWHSNCHIHTEQPRSNTYRYTSERQETGSERSERSSHRKSTSSSSREFSPMDAVNILPETLVTGAANVASSAFQSAKSVLDMFRPRHEVVTGFPQDVPTQFKDSMRKLQEMGFQNYCLNLSLLKKFENDLQKVISELLK